MLWEEEQEVRDIVKHIIKLKVTCTLKSALHSCRLSTRCQSGSGSPQALTKKRKIPSEMEVAPHYTLLTLLTLFVLSILFQLLYTALTIACMPVYESFSDVGEIRVWFASKILTPCRMH